MKTDHNRNIETLKELVESKDFIPNLSVDCTIFGFHDNILKVLLLKYHDLNLWSLPGGFVFIDEDLREAADRVLFERTHLKGLFLEQFHTFGRLDRTKNNVHETLINNKGIDVPKDHWILQRFITVGYCSLIDFSLANTFPDAFNETCAWFEVNKLPDMAFDHDRVIAEGLEYLRKNIDTQIAASNLLPEKFTMKDLQSLYETILGEKFRRNNFQRKILSMNSLERLEKLYDGSANKAPFLYKFIKE
ncbi:NUDIX hydrolase [Chryseobacterium wangxinyae]|uniref:NUDIX hydrolase n=1 Tax=unclassified Chryseobacterium TaxID=2593645 RepID=UPI002271D03B|nr:MULTISPECIES: NUDIX domain-containing protein [unclassified Chryseobacterium]MCY0968529.1 NUDIX domain-containing protein [Chryseobacterium sp. CY353]MCY0978282.1 NUDIX domain-containing protein [Chryseobacterium sp. CY350]WBZ96060.1 NUDIX domain-containing protein [Chryseobacterium sp. CY350]